jgi:cation-transporting ATPase 13A1
MSVEPYPIKVLRGSAWVILQTNELLPGDVVSVGELGAIRPMPITALTD